MIVNTQGLQIRENNQTWDLLHFSSTVNIKEVILWNIVSKICRCKQAKQS